MKNDFINQLLMRFVGVGVVLLLLTSNGFTKELFRQETFEDFTPGSVGNSGQNIYIRSDGAIDVINRFDYNNDGYIDIFAINDHCGIENVDGFIYWNNPGKGFQTIMPPLWEDGPLFKVIRDLEHQKKDISMLPSLGGGKVVIKDFNNDSYPDIAFVNFIHGWSRYHFPLFIYWGSKDGYKKELRSDLPTLSGYGLAAEDLNGDGFLDIVIANYGYEADKRWGPKGYKIYYVDNQESYIYWGGPTGFELKKRTSLPTKSAIDVAIKDINKDGYYDLIFLNSLEENKCVYVYYGNTEGYSEETRVIIPCINPGLRFRIPNRVIAEDLNRDGYDDLIVTSSGRFSEIFWGSKSGFKEKNPTKLPTNEALGLAVGDLNSDGWADIVFANSSGKSWKLMQTLTIPVEVDNVNAKDSQKAVSVSSDTGLLSSSIKPHQVLSGKVRWEVEFKADSPKVDYYVDGQLEWTEEIEPFLYMGDSNGYIDTTKLSNGPHTLKVAASVVMGKVMGNMSYIYWGGKLGYSTSRRDELPTVAATSCEIADVNRDGYPDIIFANYRNRNGDFDVPSYIYWGGSKGFDRGYRSEITGFGAVDVAVADLNGDKQKDIFLMNRISGHEIHGGSYVYWGNKYAYYSVASMDKLNKILGPYAASTADINGDGFADILGTYGKKLCVYYGSLNGFSEKNIRVIDLSFSPTSSSIADFNRDGCLDILLVGSLSEKENVVIYSGKESGFFLKEAIHIDDVRGCQIADMDKDGYLDCLFSSSAEIYIYYGDSKSQFSKRVDTLKIDGTGLISEIKLADLDSNGYLDLIVCSFWSRDARCRDAYSCIFWNGPNGLINNKTTRLNTPGGNDIKIADLNNDNYLDLVVSNYHADNTRLAPLYIFWGNAKSVYSDNNKTCLPAKSASANFVADLNADGYKDIVVYNHVGPTMVTGLKAKGADHTVGSYIYWGSKRGFSSAKRSWFPSYGVHCAFNADAGNIYDRKYQEKYESPKVLIKPDTKTLSLKCFGRYNQATILKAFFRCSPNIKRLSREKWKSSEGQREAADLVSFNMKIERPGQQYFQYKLIMGSINGSGGPSIRKVVLESAS